VPSLRRLGKSAIQIPKSYDHLGTAFRAVPFQGRTQRSSTLSNELFACQTP